MTFDRSDDRAASRVYAGPAVAALIDAEILARLRGEAARSYHCCSCGQPGRTDAEPANVIVHRSRVGVRRVRFAHARCADSQVAEVEADTFDAASLGAMLAKAAVLQYASGPPIRPLLILEPQIELSLRAAGGESVNLWMSGLVNFGFTLLRTSGQFPCLAPGWLLHLGPDVARLLGPDGAAAYEGGLAPPRTWLDLVRFGDTCVVLIGTIGLGTCPGYETTVQDLRHLLSQAAQAGGLAGALVKTQYA